MIMYLFNFEITSYSYALRNFIERSHVLSTLVLPMKTSPKPTAHGHNQDFDIDADEIQNMSITKMIHISPFYSHNDFPHIPLHLLLSPTLSLILGNHRSNLHFNNFFISRKFYGGNHPCGIDFFAQA